MMTFIAIGIAYILGFWIGRKVGIAETMLKVQNLIVQLQNIEKEINGMFKQWNEDDL